MQKHVHHVVLAALVMLAPVVASVQSPAVPSSERTARGTVAPGAREPAARIVARRAAEAYAEQALTRVLYWHDARDILMAQIRAATARDAAGNASPMGVERYLTTVLAMVKSALALGCRVLGLEVGS